MTWKFSRSSLLALLVGISFLSVLFADFMNEKNAELNFFLPFSRFWELLVGSVLAFLELKYGRFKNSLAVKILPIVGLFLIVHSILSFDAATPHPGFETLIPIGGVALLIAFCSQDDLVGKALSSKPIIGIGVISYSLYLWHFPIFAFGRVGSHDLSNFDKFEYIIATLILSVASYFIIEKPFRNAKLINLKIFLSIIFCIGVLLIVSLTTIILEKGYQDRLPTILSKSVDERPFNRFKQDGRRCYERKGNFCRLF